MSAQTQTMMCTRTIAEGRALLRKIQRFGLDPDDLPKLQTLVPRLADCDPALARELWAAAQEASTGIEPPSVGGIIEFLRTAGFRVALGVLGTVLLVVGLIMIAGDLTVSQAAARFGKELRGAVR